MTSEWETLTEEAEKYAEEIYRWMEMTHEKSRLNIYKEIDVYPVSNLVKMHIIANIMTQVCIKGITMKR